MSFEEQLKTVTNVSVRKDFTNYVPTHGVSLDFLLSHFADIRGVETMRQLEAYTRKVTERHHSSLAELLLSHDKFKHAVVDTAEYFVSFAYDTKVETMMDALDRFRRKMAKKDIFVWISILTVNQHFQVKDGQAAAVVYPKTWFKNAFEKSISSIKHVLFILNPITKPIALQRLWCIYELYLAVSKGYKLDICLSEEDENLFMEGLLQNTESILRYIDAIDAQSAGADPSQERKLRERIEEIPGSYRTLDTEVRDRLREWFAHSAKSFIEKRRESYQQNKSAYVRVLNMVGKLFLELGSFKEAHTVMIEALYEAVGHYGNEHRVCAQMMNNLAESFKAQGKFEDAAVLYEQALEIGRKEFGSDHPEVAIFLNNVAEMLYTLGRFDEAELYMREALDIDMNKLDRNHPNIAIRLTVLSQILYAKGDLEAAEPLVREALRIDRLQGKISSNLAVDLVNLANLLRERGDLDAAEPLMREALEMDITIFGKDNPTVAVDLSNLAVVLQQKGDIDTAERLFRQALEINLKAYARSHHTVTISMNNLAQLLQAKGELVEAEALLRESLHNTRQALGSQHPQVALRLSNLAVLLKAKGDTNGARRSLLEAMEIYRLRFGDDHATTLQVAHQLAALR